MTDESFYNYFMASLPKSVTPFIFYYEDQTYNVDLFCEHYSDSKNWFTFGNFFLARPIVAQKTKLNP